MLKDRLREVREELGLTQQQVADRAGVAQSTIMFLESGRNKSSRKLTEIALALKVSPVWLTTGGGEKYIKDAKTTINDNLLTDANIVPFTLWSDGSPLGANEVEVPYFKDAYLSAGHGCFPIEEYSGETIRFNKNVLTSKGVDPKYVICGNTDGDSMDPVIPDGSIFAINTADKAIKDGCIYGINNDGLLQLKVLRHIIGSKILIESYNPDYKPIERNIEDLIILGRMFWYSVLL